MKLDLELEEARRGLEDSIEKYNTLVRRRHPRGTTDMTIVTKAIDYDLDTEVIKDAEQRMCSKSASRRGFGGQCTSDKPCCHCRWNERRRKVLDRREEEFRLRFV